MGRPGTGRDSLSKSRPVPSRGKILSLSRCPFVPGQGHFLCPGVPKSCTVPSRWKRYIKPSSNQCTTSTLCTIRKLFVVQSRIHSLLAYLDQTREQENPLWLLIDISNQMLVEIRNSDKIKSKYNMYCFYVDSVLSRLFSHNLSLLNSVHLAWSLWM